MSKGPEAEGGGPGGRCDRSVEGEMQGWRGKRQSRGHLVNPAKTLEQNPEQSGSP